MKIQLKFSAALAVLLIILNTFPIFAANTDGLSEMTASSQSNDSTSDSTSPEEWLTVTSGDLFPSSDSTPKPESPDAESEGSDLSAPDEAPAFSAHIEFFHGQGYMARGTFTEFLPGTSLVRPLYSLDGEVWQACQTTWNLQWLDSETADELKKLHNQACLYSTHEPLSDYLAGQLERFYLKLQITLENGITYETQAAVIDRGDPQPIPEDFTPVARFTPSMLIRQWRPFKSYGQYQITIRADAAPEDIFALLPDTLPIEVQFYAGADFVTNAIVDCPVTWKTLSLSRLTPGESITITDAAEEIIVPPETLLNTPNGIFQLNKPLSVDHGEIRLILNVVSENAEPTGVLACEIGGLQMSFHLKPTGATAIRTYTLSEDGTDWVELPEPLLPKEVNAPSSAAGSIYTFILKDTSEPYQSYLAAWNAGIEPTPFLVGLKIEGGVYDGRHLILAWPDTYELPAKLPELNGSGGNECNAGSDNKNDSTPEGQRPGLPQDPEDDQDNSETQPPLDTEDDQDNSETQPPWNSEDEEDNTVTQPSQNTEDDQDSSETQTPQDPGDDQDNSETQPPLDTEGEQDTSETQTPLDTEDEQDNTVNQPPLSPGDEQDTSVTQTPQNPEGEQDNSETQPSLNPEGEQDTTKTPTSQLTENTSEAQQPAPYIPEISETAQPPEDQHPEQLNPLEEGTEEPTGRENDSSIQIPVAETAPPQIAGAEDPASVPVVDMGTGSPVPEKKPPQTGNRLHRLLLPATAAVAIGICIAAAVLKIRAGSMTGRISTKIMRAIYRLLHLK